MLPKSFISFVKHPFLLPRIFCWGMFLFAMSPLFLSLKLYFSLKKDFPELVADMNTAQTQAIQVFSADGKLLCKIYNEGRTAEVSYKDLPTALIQTFVAVEDSLFWEHNGIILSDIWEHYPYYHRTIPIQLASGLSWEITDRNIGGMITKYFLLPFLFEHHFTKEEILLYYLNNLYLYESCYGIENTSQQLFHTPTQELNLQQIALLGAMTQHYMGGRLYEEQEEAVKRRNKILSVMASKNIYPPAWKDSLQALPLGLVSLDSLEKPSTENEYIKEYVALYLKQWQAEHPERDIYSEGVNVYTGIDSRMQTEAENAMKAHLAYLQPIFDKENDSTILDEKSVKRWLRISDTYGRDKESGESDEVIFKKMDKKYETEIYTLKGIKDTVISEKEKILYHLGFLQAGMCAVDPQTGQVKVYIAGIDYRFFPYNQVSITKRHIGSAIKPLRFVNQLEAGVESCEIGRLLEYSVGGVPYEYPHKPTNQELIEGFARMGVESKIDTLSSFLLGNFDMSISELAGCYTPFVNKGVYTRPQLITKIESQKGNWKEEITSPTWQATSPTIANEILKMLHHIVSEDYGTGTSLVSSYKIKSEIAGKNGGVADNSGYWFTGLSHNLVTTIWVGSGDRTLHFKSMEFGQPSKVAMPIFGKWLHAMEEKRIISPTTFGEKRMTEYCPRPKPTKGAETAGWE